MGKRTFAIIKPDAVRAGNTGKIMDRIISAGFNINGAKLLHLSLDQAENFYRVHRGKPFFEELTTFMSSGKCMVLVLGIEDAVEKWREVIGATDPAEAGPGTIRKDFALSLSENAVHGADSDKNAEWEIGFFFNEWEMINPQ
ncbi:MAG: nucleoside-diphosphate kinase [Candidatus Neomarinimicrobiota bacterium]